MESYFETLDRLDKLMGESDLSTFQFTESIEERERLIEKYNLREIVTKEFLEIKEHTRYDLKHRQSFFF